jgi:glutamine amidotransferase
MIAIIDYGAGNIQSVYKALNFIGAKCKVTSSKDELLAADGAILPGVGSFGDTVNTMENHGLKNTIIKFINSGKPFLGICLGLQLLFPESEESAGAKGLNCFQGSIKKIPNQNGTLKIPHMGWNSLKIKKKDGIFKGIEDEPYVYFVHSYYLDAKDKSIVAATTRYGVEIDAAIEKDNVIATQFHPEKSGKTGLKMLKNFVEMI